MARKSVLASAPLTFQSVERVEIPKTRNGKHREIVSLILSEVQQLTAGRALKIPLADLPDSKANIRSALNRASRHGGISVATSSDDGHLYIWKSE